MAPVEQQTQRHPAWRMGDVQKTFQKNFSHKPLWTQTVVTQPTLGGVQNKVVDRYSAPKQEELLTIDGLFHTVHSSLYVTIVTSMLRSVFQQQQAANICTNILQKEKTG